MQSFGFRLFIFCFLWIICKNDVLICFMWIFTVLLVYQIFWKYYRFYELVVSVWCFHCWEKFFKFHLAKNSFDSVYLKVCTFCLWCRKFLLFLLLNIDHGNPKVSRFLFCNSFKCDLEKFAFCTFWFYAYYVWHFFLLVHGFINF